MNKKRPTEEHFDKFAFGNASSATECTGLITHIPTQEEEEAYMAVYDYQASPCGIEQEILQENEGKNKF